MIKRAEKLDKKTYFFESEKYARKVNYDPKGQKPDKQNYYFESNKHARKEQVDLF